MRLVASAIALVALAAVAPSHADDRPAVVLLESDEGVPTRQLVGDLRLHLGNLARVDVRPANALAAPADRLAQASAIVNRKQAVLAVWIERSSGDEYIVYAVGRDPSRALIEVVRIPADDRASTVRVMALKVANLVDVVLSSATGSPDVAQSFARAHVGRTSSPSYGPLVELGALGAVLDGDAGAQIGGALFGGVGRRGDTLDLAALLGVRWMSGIQAETPDGQLEIDEVDVALSVRGINRRGVIGVGLDLSGAVRLLDATAEARDGRTDSAFTAVPVVGSGVNVEWAPWRALRLRAHVGVETAMYRQRFLVLEKPAVDLGRFRVLGGIALVAAWN